MSLMYMFMYSNNSFMLNFLFYIYILNNESYINTMMMFMSMMMMKMIFFSTKEKMINYFLFIKKKLIMLMLIILMLFFWTKSITQFYIFFELISMLMFSLIFLSSFSNQRMKASIYMFMYMGMSTFPMLIMLFFLNDKTLMIILTIGFLIKIPMMFFHLWLPKAHVEANYYDSMILASILLKLGGYGIMLLNLNKKMNFFMLWMIMTIMYMSVKMIFLSDLKMIFAYSSIIHMNSMIMMLMSNNFFTEKMFILMMISHAISSSLMFYIIGMIYEYTYSRSIMINKNFMLNCIIMFMIIFFIMFINMAMPPFMTFFSEMYMYMSLINYSKKMLMLLMMMMFLSLLFNLMVIKNMGMSKMNKFFKVIQIKEKNMILLMEHFIMLMMM